MVQARKPELTRPRWEGTFFRCALAILAGALGLAYLDTMTRELAIHSAFSGVLGTCLGLLVGSALWNSRWQ